MALATYADILSAITNTLHRADLSAYTADFVTLADSRINADLRVRQMETTQTATITAGVVAVPTNYIELKDAYISSTQPYGNLERVTSNTVYDRYPSRVAENQPRVIAREGTNFIFGPYPDSNYIVTLTYYNRFQALSAGTNAIFTAYPGLWLFGALCEAEPFLKNDKRVSLWEAKYKLLVTTVQQESDDEYDSGSVLFGRPDFSY